MLATVTPVREEVQEKKLAQVDLINQPLPFMDRVGAPKNYNKLESLCIGDILTVLSYGKLVVRGVE